MSDFLRYHLSSQEFEYLPSERELDIKDRIRATHHKSLRKVLPVDLNQL